MIIALIPARGGSKRLPRKNVLPFAGRPLIQHSIDVGLAAADIDGCYVSTEDPEIAEAAVAGGAEVITRPPELASDHATTASVAQHAVSFLEEAGLAPSAVVTLQPTCPLRPLWVVDQAIARFRAGDVDSVVTVTRSHAKLGGIEDGLFVPEYRPGTRSQDLPERYFENGVVYVSDAAMLRDRGEFFGERMAALELDPLYAMGDIDTGLDFQVAEFLFRAYYDQFEI
jgi:N-acylneuraminate cytidylyltransferase